MELRGAAGGRDGAEGSCRWSRRSRGELQVVETEPRRAAGLETELRGAAGGRDGAEGSCRGSRRR
eukprot:360403-Chlamydomonas_euryale.AAC.1